MLKTIKIDKEISTSLNKKIDPRLIMIKPDKSKSKYITGQTVIDLLNLTFGHAGWSWKIDAQWTEDCRDKITKTKWENNQKRTLPKNEWIIEEQGPVCHTRGTLTVFFEREDGSIHAVSKTASGAQPVTGGQSEQEHIYKGSGTDALKKAATLFGIGLEMYRKENEPNWFAEISYVNPWNEETLSIYKDQWELINGYITGTGITMDKFLMMLEQAYGQRVDIIPETINGICDMLRQGQQ